VSDESDLRQTVCALVSAGRIAEAINTLRGLVSENPRNAEAHELLGCVYHRMGNLKEAVSAFRRAVFLNPDHPDYLYNLAAALYASGDKWEAARVASECVKRQPGHEGAVRMVERLRSEGYQVVLPLR
jgi:chemotaxis protein methyltransferase WspC